MQKQRQNIARLSRWSQFAMIYNKTEFRNNSHKALMWAGLPPAPGVSAMKAGSAHPQPRSGVLGESWPNTESCSMACSNTRSRQWGGYPSVTSNSDKYHVRKVPRLQECNQGISLLAQQPEAQPEQHCSTTTSQEKPLGLNTLGLIHPYLLHQATC